ncbi:bifunctional diguanylate cyclase/phosphodiesterase [Allomesorhizobium camelthorni]|uniref:EAL domain-containing protein n=1 Tax=Allomesorhizobium camelthorni TaxID=475069 RepID=A0A6G4WHN2_9HYPH|nr:EAL domain-containing protein [Mesorhizobium camelthorni]NGO53703.1 EAL domain-containing protein [Mesorhizobium camelthorni]
MTLQARHNELTHQVTSTVLAVGFLCLALVVGFGFFATQQADGEALKKQKTFVANGLAQQIQNVQREQESIAVWDDAVVKAKERDDPWMRDNLGEWMHEYYGHDRIYVLDEYDAPIHAMHDGKTVEPPLYGEDQGALAPYVERLRRILAEAAKAESDEATPKLIVSDLAVVAGQPTILSIMPIVPSTDQIAQEPGSEYLHVTVKYLDGEVIGKIAEQYQLADARLATDRPEAGAAIPFENAEGTALGYIAWQQDRPGLTLIRKTSPALIGGAIMAMGVLVFLLRRLRRASSQLQRSQDQAQYLAFHDTLTGLPNRALFEDRLKRALVAVKRDKDRIALLYLDLDRFKHVNDTFGHPAGDELVRQTALRLDQAVREVDTVARLGGDEFAIILVGIKDVRTAEDVSGQLLGDLSRPFQLADDQVFVGASIGIAISPDFGADPDDLLRKADIALYEAKRGGRGRYQVFAGDMDDLLLRRRTVESDLRTALTTGDQIKLLYQPIYGADCETVLGAEALIRWDHPVHGALSPSHFVGIAEERGMIGLLGGWVLREACSFAAASDLPWLAVNVSPLQLRDENFASDLFAIMETAGVEPRRIQLEITEGVLLENTPATTAVLKELRGRGVRIALDDFGTGYSSVNYLRRYSIDKLKIDRSFVRQLGSSDESTAIVKALVDLAAALGIQVTAEGVETVQQRDALVAMGCQELQGFLLSPPLSRSQIGTGTAEPEQALAG